MGELHRNPAEMEAALGDAIRQIEQDHSEIENLEEANAELENEKSELARQLDASREEARLLREAVDAVQQAIKYT